MLTQQTSQRLMYYGLFLIICGVLGFLSNPAEAKTALISGGTFGSLSVVAGYLIGRGVPYVTFGSLLMVSFLALIFTWRASVGWLEVVAGNTEKLFAASLITAMLIASLCMIVFVARHLFASRKEASQGSQA